MVPRNTNVASNEGMKSLGTQIHHALHAKVEEKAE